MTTRISSLTATSGNLPAYTFIEPAYDDDGEGTFANSQHPDFPVDRGEELIREIYYALTKKPRLEKARSSSSFTTNTAEFF